MAGNGGRRGAVRKGKKGPTTGSGGVRRRGLEGRGPTPKAEDRPAHKKHAAKKAASGSAARGAAGRIAPVIASAAFAVVIAFATLALAQFGELRALGPAIALSVALMLLAGVTLMPALLAVTGRRLFWPSKSWST